MTESDARRILQVNGAASSADIRRAYLDLVKVWHPDRFQGDARLRERAERTLQQINDAYTLLERDAAPAPRPAVEPASPAAPEPDPVIELYKRDVDRSLLRENLKLTPEERLRKLQDFVSFTAALRDAGRRKRE